jgi:WD40 repeat protein
MSDVSSGKSCLLCFFVVAFALLFTCAATGDDLRLRLESSKKLSDYELRSLVAADKNVVVGVTGHAILRFDFIRLTSDIAETTDSLYCVARNPTNDVLAAGGSDGKVQLWDSPRTKKGEIKVLTESIYSIAVSPDGDVIAFAGRDKVVQLWSISKSKVLATLKGHSDAIRCLAMSSDGRRLLSGSYDSTAVVWDLSTQKMTTLLDDSRGVVFSTAFFSNDKKAAIGRALGSVVVFDLKTIHRDAIIQVFGGADINCAGVNALVVPKQSNFLIAGGGELLNPLTGAEAFGEICVLDMKNEKVLYRYKTKSVVMTMCLTSDGKRLLVGEQDGTISVWEILNQ